MADTTVRSLGFDIGFDIAANTLVKADQAVDRFKDNVMDGQVAMDGLGFEVKAASKDMVKGFEAGEKAIDSAGNEVKETTKQLKNAGDEAEKSGKKGKKSFEDFGKVLKTVGKAAAVAVGTAFVTVGGMAIKAGTDAQESYKIIRTGTGATGQALEDLIQVYKNVGKNTDENLGQVAEVIADLNTRTGAAGPALENLAGTILDLGDIAKEDFKGLSTSITRAMGDWGVAVENGSDMMDKLFITSQNTGIGVTALSDKLVQFGAPLRQMGFSLEESMAMLGKFEKEGVNTELVLGSLRIALGKMANEGIKDPSKGLAVLIDKIKATKDEGTATALAMEYFGARSGPDMAAAIRENRFEFGSLVTQLAQSKGAIAENAQQSMTFGEKLSQLKNNATIALEPLGLRLLNLADKILPKIIEIMPQIESFATGAFDTMAAAVDGVSNAIQGLTGFVIENWGIIEPMLAGIAAGAATFGIYTLAIKANTIATKIWAGVTKIATAVGTGFGSVMAFITSPIGLVVIAIGLLVAAGILLYRNWDKVSEFLSNTWNWIKTTAVNIFTGIKDFLANWGLTILAVLLGPIGIAALAIYKNWDGIKAKALELWEGIKATFSGIGQFFSDVFNSAWEGIKRPINFIIEGINILIRGINGLKFDIPDWIPLIGGKKFGISIPEIPQLAKGGTVLDGGAYVAGEKGAELIFGTPGATVVPNRQTKQILDGGGDTYYVEITNQTHISLQNPDAYSQEMLKDIESVIERGTYRAVEKMFSQLNIKRGLTVVS